jgi:hypothetical protein
MSPVIKGEARRHQLVTTYGVGSVIALGDESFMVAGIDYWKADDPTIHEPRLEKELGVEGFVDPPASGDDHRPDVPVVRFPSMQSCPSCGRLAPHSQFTTFDKNKCEMCEALLVPSRFIVACANGHVDDFPYFLWVHARSVPTGEQHELRLGAAGMTASLADVVISCSCGKEMTMEGAFRSAALRGIARCSGNAPWLRTAPADCGEVPRTLQRGASNVWYPSIKSALSIPPWSDGLYRVLDKHWNILRDIAEEVLPGALKGLAAKSGYSLEDLVTAAMRRRRELDEGSGAEGPDLRAGEYEALYRGRPEASSEQDFVCEPVDPTGTTLSAWFLKVMAVPRLREVRALESFTRILPPSPADAPERRAPLYESDPGWLPAIEVSGEGVFIVLNEERVRRWEADAGVRTRLRQIAERYRARFATLKKEPDRTITPRFVLLHSLAHLLINQWSLECGYPAAALRERIYSGDGMAGILVYTATTDSAGSLGGVVALAEPRRLASAVAEALERAAWCSSDPLCSEAVAAGVDSLNLAACHACMLLPEVSCEEMNVLLDRAAVVDTPGSPGFGYFETTFD